MWNAERWAGLWVSRLFLFLRKTGLRTVVTFNLLLQITFGLRAHYLQNSYGAFKGNNPFKEKKNSWWMQIDIKCSLKKWSGFLNMIIISGNSGAESNHYWSHSWGWHGRTAVNSSEKEFFSKTWPTGYVLGPLPETLRCCTHINPCRTSPWRCIYSHKRQETSMQEWELPFGGMKVKSSIWVFRVRPMRLRSANSFQAANMCSSLAAFRCWKNGDHWRRSGHLPPGADVLGGWRWAIDHKLMTKITTQTWVLS